MEEELKRLKHELFEANFAYELAKMGNDKEKISELENTINNLRTQIKHELRIKIEKEKENGHVRH